MNTQEQLIESAKKRYEELKTEKIKKQREIKQITVEMKDIEPMLIRLGFVQRKSRKKKTSQNA